MDRRQGAQRGEADGRDPRRNGSVGVDLREIGFAFARQQAPFQAPFAHRERPSAESTLGARGQRCERGAGMIPQAAGNTPSCRRR